MNKQDFEIIVPIAIEQDDPTYEEVLSCTTELHEKYGFTSFLFGAPSPAWRSKHYPPIEHYEMKARLFARLKETLSPRGIRCGWYVGVTNKGGPSEDFIRMTRFDGSETPFASCPLDPSFRRAFAERIGRFASIAHPDFIFTEDDFSIHAAAYRYGCFCKYHLAEFAAREGHEYTREELVSRFTRGNAEDIELLRRWRYMMRDSLVLLATAAREALDEMAPGTPMGYMQAGTADNDGDCTEAISRAFAGNVHTPYSRIYGAFYNGIDAKIIPERLFHALYSRQHIGESFRFYHESDTFPHTVYFTTGANMRTLMGSAYSYGFEGSTFQAQQLIDDPNEETAFAKMYREENKRFARVSALANKCEVKGISIPYDPFYHTLPIETTHQKQSKFPTWVQPASRLGMPFTSLDSDTVFLDATGAKYFDDSRIKSILSGLVFIDGDAAVALTERGYSDLIGATVTREDVAAGPLTFDLGARDVIRRPFRTDGRGKHMPSTHMFSNGGCGTLYRISNISENAEIISDLYNFEHEYIAPTMTLYKNALGGRVLVMGMTLLDNNSQSLYNYRRQRLWQSIIARYCDKFVFAKETAHVYVIMNEARNEQKDGFFGMVTLTNLADDTVTTPALHLPAHWQGFKEIRAVNKKGALTKIAFERTDDGVILKAPLNRLDPVYLVFSR